VGIDIGGTFTDVVIFDSDSGGVSVGKRLTSSGSPAQAVIEVMREMLERDDIDAREVGKAIHGTTLVTNAIIERKGAATGLLTTRGFRDALEIGREMRYDIYDIFLDSHPIGSRAGGGRTPGSRREIGRNMPPSFLSKPLT
jgi:N-methylhydantoinase A/oxoprolinase/acetone carboxylase beta subunit